MSGETSENVSAAQWHSAGSARALQASTALGTDPAGRLLPALPNQPRVKAPLVRLGCAGHALARWPVTALAALTGQRSRFNRPATPELL